MNEVRKLDNTELAWLDESCNNVASQNWDGHISVEQDDFGHLDFRLFSEEDEEEAHFTAIWAATIEAKDGEVRIFAFFDENENDAKPVHLSLCPHAIVGLLGL